MATLEGIARVQKEHPDVDIFVAAIDDHLNADAGDSIFGTKYGTDEPQFRVRLPLHF